MSEFPDLSSYGYQVQAELGHNRVGGRVTYLATSLHPETLGTDLVVIKQFQFASHHTSWSAYDAYQREIQVLQGLNHPGIPRYLDSVETETGFCLVQEYKEARSLSIPRTYSPTEIKQIALSILEILIYLQNRIPPIIHRDIKPENILIDDQINVYLVDFGFAQIGQGEMAMSSMVKGTLGFMPPEQLFNRPLSEASDLYSLGATIICLLTNTKSVEIGNLIDHNYRINFKPLATKLSHRWVDWLEKMVQPNPLERYENAQIAWEKLKLIYVWRSPEMRVSEKTLNLTATKLNQQLTKTITVRNFVPETELIGTWSVTPHPSDPPHQPNHHAWISLSPVNFQGNQLKLKITVQTRKLMANKIYSRQLILSANSVPEQQTITINLRTAPLPINHQIFPIRSLLGLITASFFLGFGGQIYFEFSQNFVPAIIQKLLEIWSN